MISTTLRLATQVRLVALLLIACLAAMPGAVLAQGGEPIYIDGLVNGFQNWSWATVNTANTSPVHSGKYSISVNAGPWQALYLSTNGRPYHANLYRYFSFYINGGPTGGQKLNVQAIQNSGAQKAVLIGPLAANTWTQINLTPAQLGLTGSATFDGFWLQETAGATLPVYYVDDVQLVATSTPSTVSLNVNAAQTVRKVDGRTFGININIWDGALTGADYPTWLGELGTQYVRWPGGSLSDTYDWSTNKTTDGYYWYNFQSDFSALVAHANIPNQVITADYGSGSPQMAAAWVAYSNASPSSTQAIGLDASGRDWKTAGYWASLRAATPLAVNDGLNFLRINHPTSLGVKYWEIGNEVFGFWETDQNTRAHDPVVYAKQAQSYISLMKAVDPTVKVGVVSLTDEDSYANYSDESVLNPVTHIAHNGWSAVLLSTLNSLGVLPDFVIIHQYNENPWSESDGYLLQSGAWASMAASTRLMLNDYLGAAASQVEIQCTEHNSVSSSPGKQSVSVVASLFAADSVGQILQTEFNSLCWWTFGLDGGAPGNNNNGLLYGWRNYGAYGVARTSTDRYPTYYAWKLLAKFVKPGDTVVPATTSFSPLSIYAAHRADGTLALLVINKRNNKVGGAISLTGFTPKATATLYSYGVTQDSAAKSGGTGAGVDINQSSLTGVSASFRYTFPAYTASVIVLTPGP